MASDSAGKESLPYPTEFFSVKMKTGQFALIHAMATMPCGPTQNQISGNWPLYSRPQSCIQRVPKDTLRS